MSWTWKNTLIHSQTGLWGSLAWAKINKATDRNDGNPGAERILALIDEHPKASWLVMSVIAPALEEAGFRLAPSWFADRIDPVHQESTRWLTGVATSISFAYIHTLGTSSKRLPLIQALLGMNMWYVQRKGGFLHACLTHMIHNGSLVSYHIAREHG